MSDPASTPREFFADDEFIGSLHEDPARAALQIVERFERMEQSYSLHGEREFRHTCFRDAYWFLQEWVETRAPNLGAGWVVFGENDPFENARSAINGSFASVKQRAQSIIDARARDVFNAKGRSRYAGRLGLPPMVEFDDASFEQVQLAINALRDEIQRSPAFTSDHRRRLLHRLELLQAELHKQMSDLDRFWAFVGEAALAVGQCAEDVKPVVDRLRELVEVFERAMSVGYRLPIAAFRRLLPGRDEGSRDQAPLSRSPLRGHDGD